MSKDKDALKTTVLGRYVGGPIFEPKISEEEDSRGEPFYSACVILNNGEEKKIKKIRDEAIKQKFGDKPPKTDDWTIREGDDEEYEASYGSLFINPKSKNQPELVIKRAGVLHNVTKEDDLLYPGCYVAISVNSFCYDKKPERNVKRPGVSLSSRAIMFLKHGERLSDVVNAEAEFDGFDSEIEDADDDDIPY